MEEVKWERHDLIYLTPEGKRQAFRYGEKEAGDSYSRECFQKTISRCPGIVRRQEYMGDGPRLLQLGFSWYERRGGSRMRFASQADFGEIVKLEKPWEVCTGERHMKNQKLEQRLRAVLEDGKKCGIRLGVFGSCAMELATGLPYTDQGSDLDLIAVWDKEKIRDFLKVLCDNDDVELWDQILEAYGGDSKKDGALKAVLSYVTPPSEEELAGIRNYVAKRYGRDDVDLVTRQDPSLGSGFTIQIGNDVIDWSANGRIRQIQEKIREDQKKFSLIL